ncbi:TIGR01906 family membrane protein [Clostridium estertheticum]|uniref:TIGR01906 family membrane protein n=1 Tax=Clostridium estertheticum TaxID=238834 RepID=UPI00209B6771|nr:TIGR01906 family membrane protein [Clostridium estertheticum]
MFILNPSFYIFIPFVSTQRIRVLIRSIPYIIINNQYNSNLNYPTYYSIYNHTNKLCFITTVFHSYSLICFTHSNLCNLYEFIYSCIHLCISVILTIRGDFVNVLNRSIINCFSVTFIIRNTKAFIKFLSKAVFISSFVFSFLILSVYFTLLFKPLYYMDIGILNIENSSGLNKSELKSNYDYVITYVTQNTNEEFNLPTLPSSVHGKIHFKEVKVIFDKLKIMLFLSILVSIIGILINKKRKTIRYLLTSSISLIVIPILLLIPFLVNFDKSFTTFHHIFFNNNYWLFDIKSDPIITILPQSFFFHCAILMIFLITMCSITLSVIYKTTKKSHSI